MKRNYLLLMRLCMVLLIIACRKRTDDPIGSPVNKLLEIRLDTAYLPAVKIDSAIAIWEGAGVIQRQKFLQSGEILRLPLELFSEGPGVIAIQLYSQVKREFRNLQFEKRWAMELSHHKPLVYAGPKSFDDAQWLPRVILTSNTSAIIAIIGLRPADPYFSLRNLPAQWPVIELERGYYKIPGGAQFAGKKIFKCDAGCGSFIEDRNYFESLVAQIGSKDWAWMEIGLGLFSKTDQTSFGFSYGCLR